MGGGFGKLLGGFGDEKTLKKQTFGRKNVETLYLLFSLFFTILYCFGRLWGKFGERVRMKE